MKNNKIKIIITAIIIVILIFSACAKEDMPEAISTPKATPKATEFADSTTISTPTLSPAPLATATPVQQIETADDGRPWYIRVDTYNQVVSVYALDDNDEYTRLINQFISTAGKRDNYTKKLFQVLNDEDKYRWKYFSTFGGGYCEYVTRIYRPFLFHSMMFEDRSEDKLMTETYIELSYPDSHGCIRLMPQDAKWIYENSIEGTYVEVVDGISNPDLTQLYMPPPLIDGEVMPVHEPFGNERKVAAVIPNWDNFPSDGGWVYDPEIYG